MKIIGEQYTGDLVKVPIPLEVNRNIFKRIDTDRMRLYALWTITVWRDVLELYLKTTGARLHRKEYHTAIKEYNYIIKRLTAGMRKSKSRGGKSQPLL